LRNEVDNVPGSIAHLKKFLLREASSRISFTSYGQQGTQKSRQAQKARHCFYLAMKEKFSIDVLPPCYIEYQYFVFPR
jgi:hypothetical protein